MFINSILNNKGMKRLLQVLIIALILIPLASAGEIVHVDVSKEDNFVALNERDVLAFSLKGGEHKLMIRKVDVKAVDLTMFTDINRPKSNEDDNLPYYFTLKVREETANLDVDKDHENDATVSILDVSGKKVLLSIKEYQEKDTGDVSGNAVKNGFDIKDIGLSSIIWTVLLLVIAVFLLLFVLKKRSTS